MFQLLAVVGQWDRALNQLNVLKDLDVKSLPMVQTYCEALQCEVFRKEVFQGRRTPLIFGEPEPWEALLMESLKRWTESRLDESVALRDEAFETAPATPGTINGVPFQWIADGDTRLGPNLEAVIHGRYFWIPFQRILKIELQEPEDLRDVVWMPAYFTWINAGEAAGLIPTRYVGSEALEDGGIRMARKTEWIDQGGDVFHGLGQRMFSTDAGDYAIMDIRSIFFDVPGRAVERDQFGASEDGIKPESGPASGGPAESSDG